MVSVVGGGGGEVSPLVDISPARAETESTHVKAIAARNRFMFVFSFKVEDARFLATKGIRQHHAIPCKTLDRRLISGLSLQAVLHSVERSTSHEDNLAEVTHAPP